MNKLMSKCPLLLLFALIVGLSNSCFLSKKSPVIEVVLPIPTMNSLDPYVWSPQSILAQGTIFEGLFGFDSVGRVVPRLVEHFDVSSDHRIWTFHLRKGLKWSNGENLSAYDFMYAWMRELSPSQPADIWASFLLDVDGSEDFKSGSIGTDGLGLKLLDSTTIQVRMKWGMDVRPKLALATAVPLNRRSVERAIKAKKPFWDPSFFVGNGPYIPKAFTRGQEIILEKNPNYQGRCGNIQRFILKMGGEQVEVQSYEAQDLDLAFVMGIGDYKYVHESPHLSSQVFELEKLSFNGFQVARTINPLMQNLDLRKAMAYSIDRQTIARAVLGGRVVSTSFYGPPSDSMLNGLHAYDYDLDSAHKYLLKSGYPLNVEISKRPKITFFAPPATDYRVSNLVESLQASWVSLGLNVEIENLENIILDRYTWGGGYRRESSFSKPGITLYTGEMLWPDAIMQMRLADHTWYYHNFPLSLKKKLRDQTLVAEDFSLSGRGSKVDDWFVLDEMIRQLDQIQKNALQKERDPYLRETLSFPNYALAYQRIRRHWDVSKNDADRRSLWLQARQLINDGQITLMQWTDNQEQLSGWRLMAKLYRISLDSSRVYLRDLQQQALDQAWIVPLYSEKITYLHKPWLHGEVINRYGRNLAAFNLRYMWVDIDQYWKAR